MTEVQPNLQLRATFAQRYHGAWQEINARLQSRQQVNLYFATVIITLTCSVIGFSDKVTHPIIDTQLLNIIACGLIVITWTFALWIRHNDAIIGLLSSYCYSIEKLDDPDNKLGIPSWHDNRQGLIVLARKQRLFSDWASIIVAITAVLPVFFRLVMEIICGDWFFVSVLFIFFVAGILASIFVFMNKSNRKRLAELTFEKKDNGEWIFKEKEKLSA